MPSCLPIFFNLINMNLYSRPSKSSKELRNRRFCIVMPIKHIIFVHISVKYRDCIISPTRINIITHFIKSIYNFRLCDIYLATMSE